jgi:predicted amidohydrolase
MRVGVVQMTSTDDVAANLQAARSLVAVAAHRGSELVALPENFAYLRREGVPIPCAQGLDGEIVGSVRELAKEHRIWLLGGTFPESAEADGRVYNTSVLVSPGGEIEAVYRRRSRPATRSWSPRPPLDRSGSPSATTCAFPSCSAPWPSAGRTGSASPAHSPRRPADHWEVLLRARAIENQAFVLAPAQCGRHSADRASYGRSMIVDPWGLVLARAADRPGAVVADCDPSDLERVRSALPALRHRRL